METWGTASKVGLGIASCAVFAGVVVTAGREDVPARARLPTAIESAPLPPAAANSSRAETAGAMRLPPPTAGVVEPADEMPPQLQGADIADLSRQAMPIEETTAEENEQRGDAIRRLGASASANVEAIPALVYALRNDVDIRNRILAIDGLRRAALAGNPDRGITDALIEASRSGDEIIAAQAAQALIELQRAAR